MQHRRSVASLRHIYRARPDRGRGTHGRGDRIISSLSDPGDRPSRADTQAMEERGPDLFRHIRRLQQASHHGVMGIIRGIRPRLPKLHQLQTPNAYSPPAATAPTEANRPTSLNASASSVLLDLITTVAEIANSCFISTGRIVHHAVSMAIGFCP
jgi:hypothetical protein